MVSSCRYGWIFKTNPMKKVMICLTGCFLFALTTLRAQDTTRPAPDPARPAVDTTSQTSDTAKMMTLLKDSGIVKPAATPVGDTVGQPKDSVISVADAPAKTEPDAPPPQCGPSPDPRPHAEC